ncbi:MAG: penicillin-binding protein [Robiginitomaculum sp.]|nr:MAG: penicillin-binding protein [Robiginitomaculum sp.]
MSKLTQNALPELSDKHGFMASAPTLNVLDEELKLVRQTRVRIIMGMLVFGLFFMILVSRLAEISLLRAPKAVSGMTVNTVKSRADIVDRNGELLATSLMTYSLGADPRKVWDPVASTEAIISALPGLDPAVVEGRLSSNKSFIWLRRNLTPKQRHAVFSLGLPELEFRVEPKRVYPRGRLASHILGFTDIDQNGTAGVERVFDEQLFKENAPAKRLSLDMGVQFSVEDELRAGMKKFQADAASGIVMNIKTGEILAMASMPDFNPNRFGDTLPQNRLNRASMSLYELGSTFKPITMALAHETGVMRDEEKLDVQDKLVIQSKSITDDHPSPVALGAYDILAQSSNRGVALLALRSGAEAQQDLLRRLGLFSRVPIELHESAAPLVAEEWQDITTATVAYGHGISVTPLALASALATLLNGGVYVEPTIEKHRLGKAVRSQRAVSVQTSKHIIRMMRYVVTDGTGRNAAVKGYEVMGKTGTAEKLINGKYVKNRLVTSFVAAFPYSDPQYLVFIVYDEPKAYAGSSGYATAGWNAALTARAVTERIAPLLGVKKIVETSALHKGLNGTVNGGMQ